MCFGNLGQHTYVAGSLFAITDCTMLCISRCFYRFYMLTFHKQILAVWSFPYKNLVSTSFIICTSFFNQLIYFTDSTFASFEKPIIQSKLAVVFERLADQITDLLLPISHLIPGTSRRRFQNKQLTFLGNRCFIVFIIMQYFKINLSQIVLVQTFLDVSVSWYHRL